jgi:hypothetical protein
METLEFLGGKYSGGEQILPGAIQAYRATESATGRSVFVHRISSGDDAMQQAVLYRLMAAALVRSPSVRSMILDMRDDGNDWYVVTETAPQCLLLREWLQFELGSSAKGSDATRVGGAQLVSPAPSAPPALVPDVGVAGPIPPAAVPPISPKSNNEPGEFTRFFSGGLPVSPAKPISSERVPNTDRPPRSSSVQRPHTPMPFIPPITSRSTDPGEFTRLFSKEGAGPGGNAPPSPPERPKAPTDHEEFFKPLSEPAVSPPPVAPQSGEYTRIFGKGDAPPPVQERSALGTNAPTHSDDPLFSSQPGRLNGPKSGAAPGPSEYTRVIEGGRPATPNASESNRPVPTEVPAGSVPVPPNPLGSIPVPSPSVVPPPIAKPAGSVHAAVQAPKVQLPAGAAGAVKAAAGAKDAVAAGKNNTKMIVFFAVLGLLALLMILLVVLALKK